MRALVVVASLVLGGCPKKEAARPDLPAPRGDAATTPPSTDAVVRPPPHPPRPGPATYDPSARAKQILDAQLAALKQPSDEHDRTLLATFTPDAVLLVPDPRAVTAEHAGFRDAITRRSPHEAVKDIRLSDVVAAGNESALWFTCTLTVQLEKKVESVRVTELATSDSGWKVTVAAFAEPDPPGPGKSPPLPFENTTRGGPITAMAQDPAVLAQRLEPGATVTGFTERYAASDAAQAFLVGLPTMSVDNAPREVHGTGWGFTLAQLRYEGGEKYPMRISVLVIATPDGEGGWRVVAVHYAQP